MVLQLAAVKSQLNKHAEALDLYRRALQLSQASGQRAPEAVYRGAAGAAYQARNSQAAMEFARTLVEAYPSPENWRSAIGIYRELGGGDTASQLDVFRFMRAAGALTSEADYVRYAEAANQAAAFGEVKAVLDQALGRNAITAANSAFAREMLATANRRTEIGRAHV